MTELERLLIEKKTLEAKIRALKAPVYIKCGSVKIEKKKDKDECAWQVCALSEYLKTEYETEEAFNARPGHGRYYYGDRKVICTYKSNRWWPFIREDTKEDAIKKILTVARDFRELAKQLKSQPDFNEPAQHEEEIPFNDPVDDLEDFNVEDLADIDLKEEEDNE